jgi:hypothetical protein
LVETQIKVILEFESLNLLSHNENKVVKRKYAFARVLNTIYLSFLIPTTEHFSGIICCCCKIQLSIKQNFSRSLPNWQAVQSSEAETESPQEVDQRNAKETAMLKGNLGESDIPSHEILYDANQLRSLAQLQESLVSAKIIMIIGGYN